MNRANFSQANGFPISTASFNFLQDAYSIFNAIGDIIGDKTIVSGCVETGTSVSSGVIYVDGELVEFEGGTKQNTIVIRETATKVEFEDRISREAYFTRKAVFGVGVSSMTWSDFKRVDTLVELSKDRTPAGIISMWSGEISAIPDGWYLCNGENGTPNLTGRFVVGYDPDNRDIDRIGSTGGLDKVTLKTSEMPNHSHAASPHTHSMRDYYFAVDHGDKAYDGYDSVKDIRGSGDSDTNNDKLHYRTHSTGSTTVSIDDAGGGEEHENRPPYFALAYIMKGI